MFMPSKVEDPSSQGQSARVEPIYGLTDGLSANKLREAVREALRSLPPTMPDWLHPDFLAAKQWPDFRQALLLLHSPGN